MEILEKDYFQVLIGDMLGKRNHFILLVMRVVSDQFQIMISVKSNSQLHDTGISFSSITGPSLFQKLHCHP